MLSALRNIITGYVNSSHTISVCVHPWHHWVIEGALIKSTGVSRRHYLCTDIVQKKLHQVSNPGNLFKELTSEKYLSVIRGPILRLAVILMMFIKHSSSYYVSWHSSATLNPTATDLLQ